MARVHRLQETARLDDMMAEGPSSVAGGNVRPARRIATATLAVIAIAMTYLGIGRKTAIFALVVYSLLPIIRSTVAGIFQVDPALVDAGHGMGMTPRQVLFKVEIPNAMYIILTGIRTAVVINVGTAAMSFLVGGGGLGDLIFSGLAMVDAGLMLAGAVPTACLAIILNWSFERLENLIISP